jgi:hypothetical protein
MKHMEEPRYPKPKSPLGKLAAAACDQPNLLELAIRGLRMSAALSQPEWVDDDRHREGHFFYYGDRKGWGYDFIHHARWLAKRRKPT